MSLNSSDSSNPRVSNDIARSLYKQSAEIAGKNKTLSLLSDLYAISIQSLNEDELARRLVEAILDNLTCEIVSIVLLDTNYTAMTARATANSKRLNSFNVESQIAFCIKNKSIADNTLIQNAIKTRTHLYSENISEMWGSILNDATLAAIQQKGHVRSSLVYPLISGERPIGVLIVSLNRTFTQLLEHERESLINLTFVIAVTLDRARLYAELTKTNRQLTESIKREVEQRKKVEQLADNLKHANERLTELDKMKTEFVSIASHQMRSPLTAISGYSSLILEGSYGATNREIKEVVSKIFRSSKSMSVAVDDFLNVTRIEQGRVQLDRENFDLKELVQNTYDEYMFVAEQRGLDLQLDIVTHTTVSIYGDRNKIKQSLSNLVDNALKYTKEGWVRIGLACTKECATLSVADSGIGIPASDQERLFQKFTRATNANSATVQGTGLGLYIVKHFVNMHQGSIWFESNGENGTTFFISLPIKEGPVCQEHKPKVIDLMNHPIRDRSSDH